MRVNRLSAVLAASAVILAGCAGPARLPAPTSNAPATTSSSATELNSPAAPTPTASSPPPLDVLPGMPQPLDPNDVYAADRPDALSPTVAGDRALVYVPNGLSNSVTVIDQASMSVIGTFAVGDEPQHVVPSYDLRTLYVVADQSPHAGLTPIDPKTGQPGPQIPITDPYNLYFTPDGQFAIVVAEYYKRLDFYDPHTWKLADSLALPQCAGVDHIDFSADGKTLLASCEFANRLAVVDVASRRLLRMIVLSERPDGMPQDVKLSPDGKTFYVADMMADGVYLIDGSATQVMGFVRTGRQAHGLYIDRSSTRMFVTNRGEGSITVIDLATRKPIVKWLIPGGGSPDMGNLSADGSVFWVSGRYNDVVYAISTVDGHLIKKIPVGAGPHGLCVWPQPGRYSLGHTGILR